MLMVFSFSLKPRNRCMLQHAGWVAAINLQFNWQLVNKWIKKWLAYIWYMIMACLLFDIIFIVMDISSWESGSYRIFKQTGWLATRLSPPPRSRCSVFVQNRFDASKTDHTETEQCERGLRHCTLLGQCWQETCNKSTKHGTLYSALKFPFLN